MGLFNFKKKKEISKSGYEGIPRKYKKSVDEINSYKDKLETLTDEELYQIIKQPEFKERSREEIFAYIRETSGRILGMRHFDVQLMGGLVLTDGEVAEMKTGEGKTLTSTLSIIYKALKGEKVYVITTNEYLSERDARELEPLYNAFGLTVGVNKADIPTLLKQEVYKQDIVYTINSELVFDYLRDNMVNFKTDRVNPNPFNYALIDEVDSILIDDARTPLIISGQEDINVGVYVRANMFVKGLKPKDYIQDKETLYAELSESGVDKAEEYFKLENLYDVVNMPLLSVIRMSLKAHHSVERGVDYNIHEGKVVLINQSTGRILPNTKYSDGLHQAIEVKEGVEVTPMTKTIANITYQDFFRQFEMLSGMTGTGLTEAEEFLEIYNMRVVPVPTNKEKLRVDHIDEIYLTLEDKLDAITNYVKSVHEDGRPVLIGTASVESSEWISQRFTSEGIPHEVLNAKNHEREADIISKAGMRGAVTVATNMAGRGTDIKLGEGVKELGGLVVIGTERHESRRIDNQLRGRSGRQGDPGETYFVISLEDRVLSRYLPDNVVKMLGSMKQFKGESIKSGMVSKSLESAQKRVEGQYYDSRKNVLKFGSVLNKQRKIIYEDRNDILLNNKVNDLLEPMLEYYLDSILILDEDRDRYVIDKKELESLKLVSKGKLNLDDLVTYKEDDNLSEYVKQLVEKLEGLVGSKRYQSLMQLIVLKHLDEGWTNHLSTMSELLTSVQLRSHAQKDPYREYLNDGEELFNQMIDSVSYQVSKEVLSIELAEEIESDEVEGSEFKIEMSEEVDLGMLHVSEHKLEEVGLDDVNMSDKDKVELVDTELDKYDNYEYNYSDVDDSSKVSVGVGLEDESEVKAIKERLGYGVPIEDGLEHKDK